MLIPGIVSVTFRKLTPSEWIDLALETHLVALEWGGDIHVPHGDTQTAQEVARMTTEAGLQVAAYGSYYRVGLSEEAGLSFGSVLETAVVLGAPGIRVWCAKQGSADADADYWNRAVDDSRRIAEAAAAAGIWVAYEFHNKTLNDNAQACLRLMQEVNHPNLRTYWQGDIGQIVPEDPMDSNIASLTSMLPHLTHVHTYYSVRDENGNMNQVELGEGRDYWREIIRTLRIHGGKRCLLLEFVKDNDVEIFRRDARVLRELLAGD